MCPRYAEQEFAANSGRRAIAVARFAYALGAILLLGACESMPPADDSAGGGEIAQPGAPTEGEDGVLVPEPPLPPEAVAQFDKAVVHMSAGDATAAEQEFRALAAAYPEYSGPVLNLGILLAKSGRFEEAENSFKEAIKRNAANAAAFNQLGILHRKQGRFEDAEQAYRQAVQVDPNYAAAYLNLGVLCDLYLQQPKRALEAYERYLELAASPDKRVAGWVSELKKRIGANPQAARSE